MDDDIHLAQYFRHILTLAREDQAPAKIQITRQHVQIRLAARFGRMCADHQKANVIASVGQNTSRPQIKVDPFSRNEPADAGANRRLTGNAELLAHGFADEPRVFWYDNPVVNNFNLRFTDT